jgi:hypothetical protein
MEMFYLAQHTGLLCQNIIYNSKSFMAVVTFVFFGLEMHAGQNACTCLFGFAVDNRLLSYEMQSMSLSISLERSQNNYFLFAFQKWASLMLIDLKRSGI